MLIANKKKKFSFNKENFICVYINNYEYFFDEAVTIYQALLEKSWYLPRFCYHVKLALAGNCRMCLIEIKGTVKPIIACATLINNNLELYTSTILAFKARENILEFLLVNHPIDCPICDKGGECDLQDQYMVMGSLFSRYYELNKKSIINKDISFLIKLSLNKCINCTRCTRYSQSVTGEYVFSLLGRGENSFISNYLNNFFIGEITGNVIDLCPVGASTSKIISYDFRLWELVDVKYVDFFDVMHPPIRLDFRGLKLLRILPLSNNIIQEEWISDKLRFNFKVFFKNRFYLPYLKNNNLYFVLSWKSSSLLIKNFYYENLKNFIKKKLFFMKKFTFCENIIDLYSFFFFKKYFKKMNFFNNNINLEKNFFFFRKDFMIMQKDLDYLDIDNFIFFDSNLRYESPILNFKIREKIVNDFINIYVFGQILELNYIFLHLGNNLNNFIKFYKKIFFKEKTKIFFSQNKKNSSTFNFLKIIKVDKLIIEKSNSKLFSKELNSQKSININNFILFYFINFKQDSKSLHNFNNKNTLSILLSQNIFDLKNFNLIIPKKFSFEQNSLFLNIFGVYSDYTYMLYKVDYKTLKNDWNLIEFIFLKFLSFNKKLKLSYIKNKFIPKKWIYNEYFLKNYNYIFLFKNILNININKFFINNEIFSFFNDKFSKNNSLFNYFFFLKKKNIFVNYKEINSYFWLF